jgi:AraC-like DNA-binding protein
MNYQTFEPNSDLESLVKCYWTLESESEDFPEKQTIVPDGCMEMIFHCGDLYRQYTKEETSIIQPRCFVIGQLSRPIEIEPMGQTSIFSVRFHPNGFSPFTTKPIKEMENTAIPLEELFVKEGLEIEHKVLNAASTSERKKAVEKFLYSRLTNKENVDRIIKSTVDTILTGNGQLSIVELSKQLNINRRQLERKFASSIGLSPKQLSKTVRLQVALKLLLNKNYTSLTALAYENEYYDQAHFIKDFKDLTGFTPREFYGDKLKMSSLFYSKD